LGLPDEVIHLTSAFQLAGYPHVIGTQWGIRDTVAVDVAVGVYSRLEVGPGHFDLNSSARALRAVIREQRDRRPGQPSVWAAYVHAGA
jgi:CHAT domain-containing protein